MSDTQSGTIPTEKTKARYGTDAGRYFVTEVFCSIQGEGVLAGVPMIFVRFGGCNLRCRVESTGFDCDTDFQTGATVDLEQLADTVEQCAPGAPYTLLTGGEPALQVDEPLIERLHALDYKIAIETNGTVKLPNGLDHICLSPKSAWHTLRQRQADSVKIVCAPGQSLPDTDEVPVAATNWLVSPAFNPDGTLSRSCANHCVELVKANPNWRLSVQIHKFLQVR